MLEPILAPCPSCQTNVQIPLGLDLKTHRFECGECYAPLKVSIVKDPFTEREGVWSLVSASVDFGREDA